MPAARKAATADWIDEIQNTGTDRHIAPDFDRRPFERSLRALTAGASLTW